MKLKTNQPFKTAAARVAKSVLLPPLAFAHRKYTKGETHFIMKKATGGNDLQVSILPDDKWLGAYLVKEYKSNAAFKKAVRDIANPAVTLVAGGAVILGGVIAAAVAAVTVAGATAGIALLMGTAAFAAGSIGLGFQLVGHIQNGIRHFKNTIVPDFKKNIALAYAKHKTSEFKNKWKSDFNSALKKARGKTPEQDPVTPAPNAAPNAAKPKVRRQLKGAFSLAKQAWRNRKPGAAPQKSDKPGGHKPPQK